MYSKAQYGYDGAEGVNHFCKQSGFYGWGQICGSEESSFNLSSYYYAPEKKGFDKCRNAPTWKGVHPNLEKYSCHLNPDVECSKSTTDLWQRQSDPAFSHQGNYEIALKKSFTDKSNFSVWTNFSDYSTDITSFFKGKCFKDSTDEQRKHFLDWVDEAEIGQDIDDEHVMRWGEVCINQSYKHVPWNRYGCGSEHDDTRLFQYNGFFTKATLTYKHFDFIRPEPKKEQLEIKKLSQEGDDHEYFSPQVWTLLDWGGIEMNFEFKRVIRQDYEEEGEEEED